MQELRVRYTQHLPPRKALFIIFVKALRQCDGATLFPVAVRQLNALKIGFKPSSNGHSHSVDYPRQRRLFRKKIGNKDQAPAGDLRLNNVRHQQINIVELFEHSIHINTRGDGRVMKSLGRGFTWIQPKKVLKERRERPHLPTGYRQVEGEELSDLANQLIMRPSDAIPLKHDEFRVVFFTLLTVAEYFPELINVTTA